MKHFTRNAKRKIAETNVLDDRTLFVIKKHIFPELKISKLTEESLYEIEKYAVYLETSLVNAYEEGKIIDDQLLSDNSYVADELSIERNLDLEACNKRLTEIKILTKF